LLQALHDLWENRYALRSQFYVNIKTTVATTRLGVIWWILDPLLLMLIYYFVVKIVFDRGGPNYHLFALSGIVTWQTFSRSINLCTGALVRSAGLIKQASLPMVIYVFLSPVVQAFFYIIGLAIIMIWNFPVLGWHTLTIIVLIILLILMSFTAGLFLSVFEVYSRDTGKLVTYLLRFGFYLSPVLYSPDRVYGLENIPDYAKILYSLNPMVHFITAVRDLLFYGKMFSTGPILIMFAVTFIFMQFGLYFFRYMTPNLPKRL
jgi:ABC-type polysaccharide/polyol phosphate export permease